MYKNYCTRIIFSLRVVTDYSGSFQIAANEWVTGGHCAPLWDMLPLVTREHLTEEEHAHIINKMVAGSIAPRETIIEALDRNDYNHVTATYFLLAERKLRAHRQEMLKKSRGAQRRSPGVKPGVVNL